ncbi:MAG: hypothetical protein HY791_04905 [Deltaproteobacteria bacterium]|nr:hypothetical protein [Deltaproteobacteria bacterium]
MTDDLAHTLRDLIARLERLGVAYMVVGSFAALAHGRTRATQDLDLVVELSLDAIEPFIQSLPPERFYVSEDAAREAIRRQTMFNVIDTKTGWKIDLVPLKSRPFSASEFGRRRELDVLGVRVWVASIEDTIVSKLEWSKVAAGSGRQEDVRELLRLGSARLDRKYLEFWVTNLGLEGEWATVREEP